MTTAMITAPHPRAQARPPVQFSQNHPGSAWCVLYRIRCGYFECIHGHVKRVRPARRSVI